MRTFFFRIRPSRRPVVRGMTFCVLALALCLAMSALYAGPAAAGRVTLLVPSRPTVEAPITPVQTAALPERDAKAQNQAKKQGADSKAAKQPEKKAEKAGKQPEKKSEKAVQKPEKTEVKEAPAAEETVEEAPSVADITDQVNLSILASVTPLVINEEIDLLMAGMETARCRGVSIDPPRLFTIYRFDKNSLNPLEPASREDRLGDMEEIRYLDQKAWGINVGLSRPGLHQFAIVTQPWWDPSMAGYAQHMVKVMLPVYGRDWGWHLPLNLPFEIVPEVRPFGLTAPALFTGRVLVGGKPAPDLFVTVCRVNTEQKPASSIWTANTTLRASAQGSFSAILSQPGWWCCMATREGEPLKGPDGQPSPLFQSALFWLYVEPAS